MRDDTLWNEWMFLHHAYRTVARGISAEMDRNRLPSILAYSVLLLLSQARNSRLTHAELADHTLVSRSRITRLVRSLEESGYVRHAKDQSDKRLTYAVLTDRGASVLNAARPTFIAALRRYLPSNFPSPITTSRHATVAAGDNGGSAWKMRGAN